ncbi:ABC transporter permease [Lutispora thermophila]|uniref:Putative ABC transport system permease protein n=1 Tax=Lutispora thermophila DSM 19022 TaxID=1122184 RepID=A0A1M6C2K0_9FIRM|nr:ABC transporter permease [Lutispora thermophila]SHI55041.1 putative ABC transport system permease protein [Lutispora thermophila DSM 19022]
MKKLDLRLLRMIKASKGQFISVVIIIMVGLSIFISFSTTAVNMRNAIDYYYEESKLSHIHVQLMRIPQNALNEIESMEGVTDVQGRISFDVPLKIDDKGEKVTIRIISMPEGGGKVNRLYPGETMDGLNQGKTILIRQFAQARNIKPGDIIQPYINGREHSLKVADVASSSEFVYLMENEQTMMPANERFGVAYVAEEFAQSVYGFGGSYNELLIRVKDEDMIDDIARKLEERLDKYGVKRIVKREDQLSNKILSQELLGLDIMAAAIPVLFLIVAGIIIVIVLSRIVSNDRMSIGVLKALGYSNGQVLLHYLKYALIIGITGSVLGIIVGLVIAGAMSEIYAMFFEIPLLKVEIHYIYIIYSIVLTSLFCMVSGFMGARRVLGIMPADSMRPEPPKSGKHIFIENISFIWSRLSFSWKMVIRNIMRTKRRFVFLVMGLAMAFAINTIPIFMWDNATGMFYIQYGKFQKMDYIIGLAKPMNENVIYDVKGLLKVGKLEPRVEYPFEISNGLKKLNANIVGVPRNTMFYEFRNEYDEEVILPYKGIFITEYMAKALNVKKGDYVRVRNFIPGKDDMYFEVKEVIKQYLGVNAYMDIEHMREKLTEKNMITAISVASKDDVKTKLEDIRNISFVNSREDMTKAFEEYMDVMLLSINIMILFGGILGFALIYNSTIISISERRMELAALRVMGFDKREIFWMLAKENFVITVISILLGIPMGTGMIYSIADAFNTEIYSLPMIITTRIFILAGLSTVLFVSIAQLAALKKIHNINFIDALKSRIS